MNSGHAVSQTFLISVRRRITVSNLLDKAIYWESNDKAIEKQNEREEEVKST